MSILSIDIEEFDWDIQKNKQNVKKHGVSFYEAVLAFQDSNRIIESDKKHSIKEDRKYCYGKVDDKILTVRYTVRNGVIRIFGAGYWRKGKKIYEEKNSGK